MKSRSIDNLMDACLKFKKIAQQPVSNKKLVLDPRKSNINFYSNLLFNAIKSYAIFLPTPDKAKLIFDNIAYHKQNQSYNQDQIVINQIDPMMGAIEECQTKLQQSGLNAVDVLKNKGMRNVNPDILNILKTNLETLKEGENFSDYKHYTLA